MTTPTRDSLKWHAERMEPLVGATITGVFFDDSDRFDVWVGLVVKLPNGKEMLLTPAQDEEFNGPGYLGIEEKGS
jgi:hypothetical protein